MATGLSSAICSHRSMLLLLLLRLLLRLLLLVHAIESRLTRSLINDSGLQVHDVSAGFVIMQF